MQQFDAIIIGTGQAGVPLAKRLNQEGWKTAIIEKGFVGGTCVNVGCSPTKAYVASALRASDARSAGDLGVETGEVSVQLKKVWQRKHDMVTDSRSNVRKALEEGEHITLIEGHARFKDDYTVVVGEQELTAEKIFINVGARAVIPDEFAGQGFMTNVEILELKAVPEHLIIIGGSYIGLEFGQMFRRFGSKVTIVEQNDRLLDQEDECISTEIQDILEKEGIKFRLGVECLSGSRQDDGRVTVSLGCETENTLTGSHLLLAVGRQPNTDDLGLENTSLKPDDDGHIPVNKRMETGVKGIYALGDCNGEGAFTHTAYNDYQIVIDQLFGDGKRTLDDRIPGYGLYIEPALGRIGMTEKKAKDEDYEVAVFSIPMSKVARANQMGKPEGLLRVVVDKTTDQILGASFLGLHADELINGIADMMYAGAPYTTIRDAMHIHPTVAEMLPTMLEEAE